jgi:putative DNA primase/helicase
MLPENIENRAECIEIPSRYTDAYLAEHLASRLHGKALYWRDAGKWLLWDGLRWSTEVPGGIFHIVKGLIKNILGQIASADDMEPVDRAKNFRAASQCEYVKRMDNLIVSLSQIPELIVRSGQLDADPMLLNCKNGTVDLSSGILRPHDRGDKITRLCNIEYQSDAICFVFDQFLSQIFAENTELINYIRRLAGYCLTGRTDEQVMAFFYGTGRNGKTSLINTLLNLLSEYAVTAQADLLMQKGREGANNELARLRGARFVAVNEVEEGSKLAEAQLKTLTGGDTVTARFLYQEYFEYVPQFKLILVGNHKPKVRGRDNGIWRRIHLVPFEVTIPEAECDPQLPVKLEREAAGILAWAVQGCLEWQRYGLSMPKSVLDATAQYRNAEDHFNNWLNECCERDSSSTSTPESLLESFVAYTGWNHMTSTKLGLLLTEEGFQKHSNGSTRLWLGVRVVK